MKFNHRVKRKINNEMGNLPVDMDRTIFSTRKSKINALPLFAQFIVLEWESYFVVTAKSGPSFADILRLVIVDFEKQLRIAPPLNIAAPSNVPTLQSALIKPNFFSYAGDLSYLNAVFNIIASASYMMGDMSYPFQLKKLTDSVASYTVGIGTSLTVPKEQHPSPNITLDAYPILTSISPNVFLTGMYSAIDTIKWLETENNEVIITGVVDDLKVSSYEKILNDQLSYINNLTDIVANANNALITDGQQKKDAISVLIQAKRIELDNKIASKKAEVASMLEVANNYSAILSAKKVEITNSLTNA
jgi:hypothetical protein